MKKLAVDFLHCRAFIRTSLPRRPSRCLVTGSLQPSRGERMLKPLGTHRKRPDRGQNSQEKNHRDQGLKGRESNPRSPSRQEPSPNVVTRDFRPAPLPLGYAFGESSRNRTLTFGSSGRRAHQLRQRLIESLHPFTGHRSPSAFPGWETDLALGRGLERCPVKG